MKWIGSIVSAGLVLGAGVMGYGQARAVVTNESGKTWYLERVKAGPEGSYRTGPSLADLGEAKVLGGEPGARVAIHPERKVVQLAWDSLPDGRLEVPFQLLDSDGRNPHRMELQVIWAGDGGAAGTVLDMTLQTDRFHPGIVELAQVGAIEDASFTIRLENNHKLDAECRSGKLLRDWTRSTPGRFQGPSTESMAGAPSFLPMGPASPMHGLETKRPAVPAGAGSPGSPMPSGSVFSGPANRNTYTLLDPETEKEYTVLHNESSHHWRVFPWSLQAPVACTKDPDLKSVKGEMKPKGRAVPLAPGETLFLLLEYRHELGPIFALSTDGIQGAGGFRAEMLWAPLYRDVVGVDCLDATPEWMAAEQRSKDYQLNLLDRSTDGVTVILDPPGELKAAEAGTCTFVRATASVPFAGPGPVDLDASFGSIGHLPAGGASREASPEKPAAGEGKAGAGATPPALGFLSPVSVRPGGAPAGSPGFWMKPLDLSDLQ